MNTQARFPRSVAALSLSVAFALLGAGCSSSTTPAPEPATPAAPAIKDAKEAPQSAGATIGIFRPSASAFALALTFTPGFSHNTVKFGAEEDLPVAGDWDGTGFVKVGTFRPSDATFRLLSKNT